MYQQNPYGQSQSGSMNPGMSHSSEMQNTLAMGQFPSQQQQQQQYVNQQGVPANPGNSSLEPTQALLLMGLPNSVRVVQNAVTGLNEYVQTQLVEIDLQRNQWGFGINLNDTNGVVRVQGCRSNPDGTPSPGQINNLIRTGDAIYKVQDVLITGNDPLNLVGDGLNERGNHA